MAWCNGLTSAAAPACQLVLKLAPDLRAPRLAQAQAEKQPSVSVPFPQVGFQNMHMCSREVRDLKECCRKFNEVGCQGRKT